MKKTYILQKDLPDSKAGDEYIWSAIHEVYYLNGDIGASSWQGDAIENNPDWFLEKKEKIYTEEDMRKCFEAARLTHPMVGFRYDIFNDYLKTL